MRACRLSPARPASVTLKLAAAPIVAGVIVLGVWVTGGVITNDFRISMALTGVWFALSAGACLLIARRWRPLRVAVIAAYLLTVGATGAYLGATTLRDDLA